MHSLLAFDFGEKRIGVAVGNTFLKQAQPLKTINSKSVDQTFLEVQKLITEWEVKAFVVGLPMHPDGNPHSMTKKATRFGNQLHGRFNLPVTWVDERYTSVVADVSAGDVDGQSAVMILLQYFSEHT